MILIVLSWDKLGNEGSSFCKSNIASGELFIWVIGYCQDVGAAYQMDIRILLGWELVNISSLRHSNQTDAFQFL